MKRSIEEAALRLLLESNDADRRVVEVTKLAITALLDAGTDVSRNSVRRQAALVVPLSGRKAGIAKSTLDRNAACREIFEAAMAHVSLTPPVRTTRVDAHIARASRAELYARALKYRERATARLAALDDAVARLRALGRDFDVASLTPLKATRDGMKMSAAKTRTAATRASYRRSVSLVRRAIARLRTNGAQPTRTAVVAATAQFNKGVPISDSTIDRNGECMGLIDEATGRDGPRLPPAPSHLRHRDLADTVMAERAVWREARRLAFHATRLLADHEDAVHRAEAERRAREHYSAAAEADRIIAAASIATMRAASPRDSSPQSTT